MATLKDSEQPIKTLRLKQYKQTIIYKIFTYANLIDMFAWNKTFNTCTAVV